MDSKIPIIEKTKKLLAMADIEAAHKPDTVDKAETTPVEMAANISSPTPIAPSSQHTTTKKGSNLEPLIHNSMQINPLRTILQNPFYQTLTCLEEGLWSVSLLSLHACNHLFGPFNCPGVTLKLTGRRQPATRHIQ